MIRYVGIDLHKHFLNAHILDEQGNTIGTARCEPVTAASLEQFARLHLKPTDQIALEVTTHVWAVVRFLMKFVARVVVSNPLATKAIASAKVKTDKVDAAVLAQLLRLDFLPSVWMPSPQQSLRRELTARRKRLVNDRTKLICRIRTTLAMRLLDCPCDLTSDLGQHWLSECKLDEQGRMLIESDLRILQAVQNEIKMLEKELAQQTWQDAEVKLLMTLPGVSNTTAATILAAIGDIERFAEPEKLASYFGLTPSTHQSASKCYHGRITKAGNVLARTSLIQAAHTAARDPGPLGHFFNKTRRRKNYNMAITATARKLAMLCWQLLKTGKPYRYARPSTVETKLSKLRVAGSGVRRKGGLGKGVDPRTVRQPDQQNQRRTGSLAQVLAKEQVAAPQQLAELKPGEVKMLQATGQYEYYLSLQHPTMRKKSLAPRKAAT
jgi:transposase